MHRQRGWVGLVVILIALVVVALLSQRLLKQSGLLASDDASTKSAVQRGVGPTAPVDADPTTATPTPRNAIERARGVEATLQQQTQEMGERIDAQTK